uniref:Uncharacterized protein n=1 Tax=Arundo donax TaxID=35708 RepID=A0A0A9BWR6_ARUDO
MICSTVEKQANRGRSRPEFWLAARLGSCTSTSISAKNLGSNPSENCRFPSQCHWNCVKLSMIMLRSASARSGTNAHPRSRSMISTNCGRKQ